MGAGKITTNSEMKELHSLADENTTRNTPKVKLTRVVLLGIPLINESSTDRKRRVTDMYEHNTNTIRTKQGSLRDVGKEITDKWCSVLILNPGSRKKGWRKVYTSDV